LLLPLLVVKGDGSAEEARGLGVEGFAGLFSADTGELLSVFFGVKPLLSVFLGGDFWFLRLLQLLLVEVFAEGSAGVVSVCSCPTGLPLANNGA